MATNCDELAEKYVNRIVEQYNEGQLDEYLDNCLDFEFILNRSRTLIDVRFLLTYGGPNV
jgi:hypothetical protein